MTPDECHSSPAGTRNSKRCAAGSAGRGIRGHSQITAGS